MPEILSSSSIISEREQRYLEQYTQRMREALAVDREESKLHKVTRKVESLDRRILYYFLKAFFPNRPLLARILPKDIKGIFVIPFGAAIGDMLVAIPLFHAIKRQLPHCKVGTFVTERNRSLLSSDPSVDEAYLVGDKRSFRNIREILRARRSGYDIVINLHIHGMTEYGLISNVIAPRGTKVSWSHARNKLYRTLYNILIPFDRNSMQSAQMGLAMFESAVELERPIEQWETRPAVVISPKTRAEMERKINSELERLGAKWYLHLNMQARSPKMEWGLENIVAFTKQFIEAYPDAAVFYSASPVMRAAIEQQMQELGIPRSVFFPTSFDLHEIAMLVELSRIVITPDTAITHFASATGRPVIILHRGLIDLPREWVALQVPSYILSPPSRYMSASDVTVDEVWRATEKILHGKWKSTATTVGLTPEADQLFQAANAFKSLAFLLEESSIPKIIETDVVDPSELLLEHAS